MDPPRRGGWGKLEWTPQVTAAMPLEAIHWLMDQGKQNGMRIYDPGVNMVKVIPEFFKTSPGRVTQNQVQNRPDVLGFFSIVLSFAKAAKLVEENESPKVVSKIMPRTDFTTIFETQGISEVIPKEHLYDIVKALACFKNTGTGNSHE